MRSLIESASSGALWGVTISTARSRSFFSGATVKVDLSKRSKEDMGFWHRNNDAHEIIFCVQGALRWETEMGVNVLRPGDMLFIPRGIAHRSLLCEESADENVLVELKIAEPVEYVAGD